MPKSVIPDYSEGIPSSTAATQSGVPIKTEAMPPEIIPADELVPQKLGDSEETKTEVNIYKINRPYRDIIKAIKKNE